MSSKRKRRLTDDEVREIREWRARSNPTLRQIARRYKVNQPSVLKALNQWDGVRRNPKEEEQTEFQRKLAESSKESPIKIQGYTQDIKPEDINL